MHMGMKATERGLETKARKSAVTKWAKGGREIGQQNH